MGEGETYMPRTVRFHQLGGPEVLKIEEQASKQPGKGEARIRAHAIGLNRAELMFIRGQYLEHPNLPAGLGYEAAEHPHRCGLTSAVRPQKTEDLPLLNAQCDPVDRGQVPEPLG